jgi:hypothetical protein
MGILILFGSISSFAQTTNYSTNTTFISGGSITVITIIVSDSSNMVPVPLVISAPVTNNQTQSTTNVTTVATNLLQVMGLSSNAQKISASLMNTFIDAQPYLKNNIVNADFAAIYNMPTHRMGYFLGADIPAGPQLALGVGAIEFGQDWYLAPINFKLGTTINYPYLGKIYNYIALDPLYDLSNSKFGAYDFLGAIKAWDISKKFQFSVGVGVGDISLIKGLDIAGTLRLNYKF